MSKETNKAISLKDLAEGESVIGYVKDLFKVPKSLTPDIENIALVTKEGTEITVWASGTLKYFRERMEQKNAPLGVLCKITRVSKPATVKATSKQKYFAEIGFNLADINPAVVGQRSNSKGAVDSEGFEF